MGLSYYLRGTTAHLRQYGKGYLRWKRSGTGRNGVSPECLARIGSSMLHGTNGILAIGTGKRYTNECLVHKIHIMSLYFSVP